VIVQVVPNGFGEQRRTWKLPPHRVAPKRLPTTTVKTLVKTQQLVSCAAHLRLEGGMGPVSFEAGSIF
jgi:hypothetical protein